MPFKLKITWNKCQWAALWEGVLISLSKSQQASNIKIELLSNKTTFNICILWKLVAQTYSQRIRKFKEIKLVIWIAVTWDIKVKWVWNKVYHKIRAW